jgi:hypothetical protein
LSDSSLAPSDIIAIIGLVVAVAAWRWPRTPAAPKIEGETVEVVPSEPVVPPETNEPTASEIDIPFPPGLYLLEYDPGVRLVIRENKVTFSVRDVVARLALSVFVASFAFTQSKVAALFLLFLMSFLLLKRTRLGTIVLLNLKKRMYLVSGDGGAWGGGWPPDLRLSIRLDPTTNQWITSLFLATVCIWSTVTPTAEGGRKKIRPFVEALEQIRSLKRNKTLGLFDLLLELWQS